jgi:hypothetical protein
MSNKQRPNSQGLWHYGCLQGTMLAHAHDRTELPAVIVPKTLSFWVLILPTIKTPELTHCGLVFFPLYLSQITNSK